MTSRLCTNARMAVLVACCLSSASAATAAPRDAASADTLFQQGRDAMKRGDYAAACPKFVESQHLDPAPGTLINLADCEERQGKLASAYAHLREALDTLPRGDERLALVRTKLAWLEKRTPRLTVQVASGAPTGTLVKRGEVELSGASLGTALPVDPGTVTVVVTAPGRRPRTFEVTIGAGQSKTLSVEPGEVDPTVAVGAARRRRAAGSAEDAAHPPDAAHTQRIAGWVLVGAGAVGLGVGAFAFSKRSSNLDRASNRCPADVCATEDDAAQFHAELAGATNWKKIGAVSLAGGVVAAAGGAILLLALPSADATSLRLTPIIAAGAGNGVNLSGAW